VALVRLRRYRRYRACSIPFTIVITLLAVSCGPEEYQAPVKKFKDASQVVIDATRSFLAHENVVEEEAFIDQRVFERQPMDPEVIAKVDVISPEEIRLRTAALDALAKYTTNLGQLAAGKFTADTGHDTKAQSDSLKKVSDDARTIPEPRGRMLDNQKFSGVASAAAGVIAAVAQLMIEKKARHELEQAVVENDAAIQQLIQLISDDCTLAYERQKATLSATGVQLYSTYKLELEKKDKDSLLLLVLADRIKVFRGKQAILVAADPSSAILGMKKAHSALVACVQSNKTPRSLAELVKSIQEFSGAAEPLGAAVQSLVSASR